MMGNDYKPTPEYHSSASGDGTIIALYARDRELSAANRELKLDKADLEQRVSYFQYCCIGTRQLI